MNSSQDILKKSGDVLLKIRKLCERHEKLMNELKLKDDRIEELRKNQSTLEERIQMLEHETSTLKLGAYIEFADDDKKEMRRKLNEYLKELDGVIAKLEGEG